MNPAASSLARRLVLVAAGLSAVSCIQGTSSTDGCGEGAPPETCVPRDQAWQFLQSKAGAGGTGAAGAAGSAGGAGAGQGGAAGIPDGCPERSQIVPFDAEFKTRFGIVGSELGPVTQKGESCCYQTVILCEGRPLWVDEQRREAPLRASSAWG